MSEAGGRRRMPEPQVEVLEAGDRPFDWPQEERAQGALAQIGGGAGKAVDQAFAQVITAQHCGVKRNIDEVRKRIRAEAAYMGERCIYRIPFKKRDKETGVTTTEYVEGPTIRAAEMVARNYGNCRVGTILASETPAHYHFLSMMVDFETGFSMMRPFRQRKNQNVGMADQERKEDITFQIGVSKAKRNVIRGTLGYYLDEVVEIANERMQAIIEKDPEKFRQKVLQRFADLKVPLARVERVIGRPAANWLVPHMARLIKELQTVADGMATPEDLWPSDAGAAADNANAPTRQEGAGQEVDQETGEVLPSAQSGDFSRDGPSWRRTDAPAEAQVDLLPKGDGGGGQAPKKRGTKAAAPASGTSDQQPAGPVTQPSQTAPPPLAQQQAAAAPAAAPQGDDIPDFQ